MTWRKCFLLALTGCVAGATTDLPASEPLAAAVAVTEERLPLKGGATLVRRKITRPLTLELQMVFFEESRFVLQVVAQPSRKEAKPLETIGKNAAAVAVINGGYFHPESDFGPEGLEIAAGIKTGKLNPPDPLGGALVIRQDKAALVWDSEFTLARDITSYVHCSPWLISAGKVVPVPTPAKQEPRLPRSFIATDGHGRWLLGIASPVGWLELAHILVSPGVITEWPLSRALNLDGGPSAGLWALESSGREYLKAPAWPIRNFIVIAPR